MTIDQSVMDLAEKVLEAAGNGHATEAHTVDLARRIQGTIEDYMLSLGEDSSAPEPPEPVGA